MAIERKLGYWVYQIVLTENDLAEMEEHIRSGRSDYVAGELLGRLKSNSKYVVHKKNDSEEEHAKEE